MSHLEPPKEFPFPFPPYNIQEDFMRNLFIVLEKEGLGIFESPTGTGKSLSLICGALTWLRDHSEHYKSELTRKVEESENTTDDDGPDWFTAATKRREEQEEVRKYRQTLLLLEKQEQRVKALKERRQVIKKSKVQKVDDEFEELFRDLHEVRENVRRELSAMSGGDVLSAEETSLLVDDYCSDDETETEKGDNEEDEDDGCLKTVFGEDVRVVSLASRQNLCVNEAVSKLGNMSLINDRCLDLQRGKKGQATKYEDDGSTSKKKRSSGCPYYRQSALEGLADQLLLEVQDIEQMVALGSKTKSCPYYGARYAVKDSQLVVLPYNTLLHKGTREASGIKLKGNVVIVDEAHNLLETIANIHSVFVSHGQLRGAHAQLSQYMQRYGKRLSPRNLLYIKQILFFMNALIKLIAGGSKAGNEFNIGSSSVSSSPGVSGNTSTSQMLTVSKFLCDTLTDNLNIFKLVQYIEKSKIAHKLHSFSQHFEGSVKIHQDQKPHVSSPTASTSAFLAKMAAQKSAQSKAKENIQPATPEVKKTDEVETEEEEVVMGSPLMQITEFLRALLHSTQDGRVVATVGATPRKSSIKYLLLNPASHFHDVVTQCRSVIVAGGTMRPVSEFRDQLFLSAGAEASRVHEFSCGHVVPGEQIMPIALSQGPTNVTLDFTYQHRGDTKVLLSSVNLSVIFTVQVIVPGGVVCFLPSYDYEQRVFSYFNTSGVIARLSTRKKVFREPKKSNQLDSVLSDYAKTVRLTASNTSGLTGSLLLSVVGGKMSEGINFSDGLGRCVVMVGLPYPNTQSPELKEKMQFLNKNVSPGPDGKPAGSVFYENLCFKAVNQSIGRAIRHRNDYASILLLDHRYSRPSSIQALPEWISKHVHQCVKFGQAFGLLRKFFVEKLLKKA
ncbi:ATP-dependent DNA helicase DDX11-like [Homarus americanus]|uniref:DNA 5'-3' helicase n=1 Tax=Homarus americanus TaxID=6706 RepID=A0A8J5JG50_HOMAM|nr:ATP-dependent DNA helicase DDX11-like [Homarus americanus]